jgi:ABC-type lipoprotein release transport system permease subunit
MASERTLVDDAGVPRAATAWLTRRWLRRRWLSLVPLALIVTVGGAGTLIALGAAQRTDTAYARYLTRADVGDITVNPGIQTTAIDAAIRDLPGITGITRDVDFHATIDGGVDTLDAWSESMLHTGLQISSMLDGAHVEMDRPVIRQGRMPTGSAEVLVNVELADKHRIEVGDPVRITFRQALDMMYWSGSERPAVGTEELSVVGIGVFPNEPLPDEVYPRMRALVSRDVAERYDCLEAIPPGDPTALEVAEALFPEGCSTVYSRYSLAFGGGEAATTAAQRAFLAAADELNQAWPAAGIEEGFGYFLAGDTTAEMASRVERSTRPTVASLMVLGVFAGAITLVLAGLTVARELRSTDSAQQGWWRLGVGARHRALVVSAPFVVAGVAGLAAATLLAWWAAPVGPVGAIRKVDPSPARSMSSWSWVGLAVLAAGLLAVATVLTLRWARRLRPHGPPPPRAAPVLRMLPNSSRPELAEGMRAALSRSGGTGLVVGGGTVAIAVFVAATVFGASLASLVSTPEKYGWPWDAAVMGGLGYGTLDLDPIEAAIDAYDGVEEWSALSFSTSISIDGTQVMTLIGYDRGGAVDSIVVADGRLPMNGDEVALGRNTADRFGVGIGDQVALAGPFLEPRPATVTGLVVLPALGAAAAERAGPGYGMFATGQLLDPSWLEFFTTFFGFHAAPGLEPGQLLDELGLELPSAPGVVDDPAFFYPTPVRPPEIIDATSMQAIPLAVGALMVVTVTIGLSVSILASVRSRRREIATLRSLGLSSRQLRRSVRVQSLLMALGAMAAGIPAGLLAGRVLWRAFAEQLGVVPEPTSPLPLVLGAIGGGIVLALLAAQAPALTASRALPANGLRTE